MESLKVEPREGQLLGQDFREFGNAVRLYLNIMITTNIAECENCGSRKGRRRKTCDVHSMVIKRVTGFSSKIKGKSTIGLCPVLNKYVCR